MTTEEFILHPDTVALILDNDTASYIGENDIPFMIKSKMLYGGYFIIYVNENDVDKVINRYAGFNASVFPFVLGLMGQRDLNASGITYVHQQPYLDLKGNGVLLGFVDTGIDYTLDAFRYEDGSSKIEYIWDQSISGKPPDEYLFGSEYSKADLNKALGASNPRDVVPHTDEVGHGTFLASVAGSRENDEYMGAAPDAGIIAVKLKRARPFNYRRHLIPGSQNNAFASDDFMLGVQYIIDKARQLRRPVSICVSLGTNHGTHDGFTRVESFLSRVSGSAGTVICCAAGNEANAGHHTHGQIPSTGEYRNIEFKAGDKHEDIHIHIVNYSSDRMSISVTSPAGESVTRVPARSGTVFTNRLILERSTVTIEYIFPVHVSGAQVSRLLINNATPGVWTITVYGDSILNGNYHAWLPITGFISPETVFLSPTPNYSIVTPATALGPVICGAYNSSNNSLYAASSWGPTRLPTIKPDLVAPGVNVSGIFPTGYGSMSGTSVAAAMTAGASALLLQWGIVKKNDLLMDTYHIRAGLISGCERDPYVEYPNNQWGYGRMNLYNTFRSFRIY